MKFTGEPLNQLNRIRTAPFINSLKIISGQKYPGLRRQPENNAILQHTHILHFIHMEISEPG